jgi:hypothetical protein
MEKHRRESQKRRRDRVNNAVSAVKDIKAEATKRIDRVKEDGLSLQRREDRIVRRQERVFVIFSEFNEHTEGPIGRRLCKFIEGSGIALPTAVLAATYERIIPVTGETATLRELVYSIQDVWQTVTSTKWT